MPAMLLPREFFLPCTATLTLGRGNDQNEGCQAVGV